MTASEGIGGVNHQAAIVLPPYADDAVLWGTLSPTVRADQAALRDYFVTAFRARQHLRSFTLFPGRG